MAEARYSLSSIYFHPTNRCNLKCKHCWITPPYVTSQEAYVSREDGYGLDVPLEDFGRALDEAMELGLKRLKLTGGEPLLRPDILEVVALGRDRGLTVDIETNGTLIDSDTARQLRMLGVNFVCVSLDGARAETHDAFRGVAGAFRRSVEALRWLVKEGIPTEIIFSLHRGNFQEFEPLLELAESLGVSVLKINPVLDFGRGATMKRQGRTFSARELLDLQRWIDSELQGRYQAAICLTIPSAFKSITELTSGSHSECSLFNIIGILGNGDVSLCGVGKDEKELVMGNIRRDSLAEIWRTSPILAEIRSEVPRDLEGVCSRCMMKNICLGTCRAHAYSMSRNIRAPYWFCQELYEEGLFPVTRLID